MIISIIVIIIAILAVIFWQEKINPETTWIYAIYVTFIVISYLFAGIIL